MRRRASLGPDEHSSTATSKDILTLCVHVHHVLYSVIFCLYPGPHDDGFDPSLSIPHSVDSPVSMVNDEGHPPGVPGGGTFGMGGGGDEGERKPGIDGLLSREAVKIDGNLDRIFEDSEEEDDEEEEEEEGPPVSLRGWGIIDCTCIYISH